MTYFGSFGDPGAQNHLLWLARGRKNGVTVASEREETGKTAGRYICRIRKGVGNGDSGARGLAKVGRFAHAPAPESQSR